MVRGVLFALVLAGCYSPSFDTCSLACANDTCPNGFECSNGRCAIAGSTCTPGTIDGGDDGMPPDNNTVNCGNDVTEAGEICFDPAIRIDVGLANIADAQFVDANGDGELDIAFLSPGGYVFRFVTGGSIAGNNTAGMPLAAANVFVPRNLDTDAIPELVHDSNADDRIEVLDWNGTMWTLAASLGSEISPAQAIAVAPTAGPLVADSIAVVYANRLRVFQLPLGGLLSPLTQSANAFMLSGGRDVAIADTEGDNEGEIAVARTNGLDIFKNTNASISVFATPNVGGTVDSVAGCNVNGGSEGEIVYAIRAPVAGAGTVGSLRRLSGNNYEVSEVRSVPNMFGSLACTDVDNDGFADAIVAAGDGGGNQSILVLRGRSDNRFEAPISFPVESVPSHLHVGDFNGDAAPDIIATSSQQGFITILRSNP